MRPSRVCLLVGLTLAIGGAESQRVWSQTATGVTVFEGVTLVPMNRAGAMADQVVVVDGGKIVEIGARGKVTIPAGAQRIDGKGKYLMPTLTDMHVHIPIDDAVDQKRNAEIFAATGVGTVRALRGSQTLRETNAKIQRGEIVGPTIDMAGNVLINGADPAVPILPKADVVAGIVKDKADGYKFIKILANIPDDTWEAAVTTAAKEGLAVVGHVPSGPGGLERALKAHYTSVEHLDGFPVALSRPDHPPLEFQGINMVPYIDESKIPAVVEMVKRAGAAVTPTQANYGNRFVMDPPDEMARRPEMKYVDPDQVKKWTELKKGDWAKYSAETRTNFMAFRCRLITALYKGGVRVMIGTDSSMTLPQQWNVHGFTTHAELEAFQKCGFTPYEVLGMATKSPAEFMGTIANTGTVEKGKRADLLLLDADPLADVANTRKIAGVMLQGRWVNRDQIAGLLKAAERH